MAFNLAKLWLAVLLLGTARAQVCSSDLTNTNPSNTNPCPFDGRGKLRSIKYVITERVFSFVYLLTSRRIWLLSCCLWSSMYCTTFYCKKYKNYGLWFDLYECTSIVCA